MDRIFIKDLEVYANHGVYSQEKDLGQKFLISLDLCLDLREAAKDKDINKTVNYGELCHKVVEEFSKEKYDLIETAAEKLAEFILINYELVNSVKVKLKKPWAPIGLPVEYAGVEIERGWHKAYIALGSNMGDKEKNLLKAIEYIETSESCKVIKRSSFITTAPWGYEEQDDFLNAVIEIKTLFNPKELLEFLLSIEKELKRERIIKWGPRTIDLDILLYDDMISSNEEMVIPHPRMEERMFVMEPLSEIAPYVVHPVLNKRIIQIKKELELK